MVKYDFVFARTKTDFNEELEKKIADGWERFGATGIKQTEPTSDSIEAPKFIYYSQGISKRY